MYTKKGFGNTSCNRQIQDVYAEYTKAYGDKTKKKRGIQK
ncbi:hypothetical protein B4079_1849 [Bacillus cereus]|nr:hypothetical protein B4079_1849 [Bacillus cereus]